MTAAYNTFHRLYEIFLRADAHPKGTKILEAWHTVLLRPYGLRLDDWQVMNLLGTLRAEVAYARELATRTPYTSDLYDDVFSAMQKTLLPRNFDAEFNIATRNINKDLLRPLQFLA